MPTIIKYVVLTASRDWFFIGLYIALFLAFHTANFLGGLATVEQWKMSVALVSGISRAIFALGMVVFICFHVRRAFDNREIDVMITKPISRPQFVVSYWMGFMVVSAILAVPYFILFWIMVKIPEASEIAFATWSFSIMLELAIMNAFALFASLILRSAVSAVLLSTAFYIASRMIGFFLLAIERPVTRSWIDKAANDIMYALSSVLPRLDMFAKSEWLAYPAMVPSDIYQFVIQAVVYVPFLLLMAVFDFKRKQF